MNEHTITFYSSVSGDFPHQLFSIKDPVSALTHFIDMLAVMLAAPYLLMHYERAGADELSVLGAGIFLLSGFLLYAASTIYHTFVTKEKYEKILKKFDHMMISVLIAGTYTPICLTVLRNSCGYHLCAAVWTAALVGIIFKFFWVTCPRWVSSVLYIGMGWLCVLAMPQILKSMPVAGFLFLLAGGLAYTVGGVIYALKLKLFNTRHKYFGSHEVFHVFVMVGTLLQYITVYYYLV